MNVVKTSESDQAVEIVKPLKSGKSRTNPNSRHQSPIRQLEQGNLSSLVKEHSNLLGELYGKIPIKDVTAKLTKIKE